MTARRVFNVKQQKGSNMPPSTNSCAVKAQSSVFRSVPVSWQAPGASKRDDHLTHCSYCGSISPEDVIKALKTPGTHFSGADWKYGWPHKFYLEVPNPEPNRLFIVGRRSGPEVDGKHPDDVWTCFAHHDDQCKCPREEATGYWSRQQKGTREHLSVKFYNSHVLDMTPEQFAEYNQLCEACFRIKWEIKDGDLFAFAPRGIQMWGDITAEGKPSHKAMAGAGAQHAA